MRCRLLVHVLCLCCCLAELTSCGNKIEVIPTGVSLLKDHPGYVLVVYEVEDYRVGVGYKDREDAAIVACDLLVEGVAKYRSELASCKPDPATDSDKVFVVICLSNAQSFGGKESHYLTVASLVPLESALTGSDSEIHDEVVKRLKWGPLSSESGPIVAPQKWEIVIKHIGSGRQ